MKRALMAGAAVFLAAAAATPAEAALSVLTFQGVSYTLFQEVTGNPLVAKFTLDIAGINGATDPLGGRAGIHAIAFNQPSNYVSATMTDPSAWGNAALGGLNASGCQANPNSNFFCFTNPSSINPNSALAAESTARFIFTVTRSANWSAVTPYAGDFKIDWIGSQNNYDLVSKTITANFDTPPPNPNPTPVPEPMSLALLGLGLAGLGAAQRMRRG